MQSEVVHPNVFDEYICASILSTKEGYTAAYTLKGICIQLLSFLGSENIEQEHGGRIGRKRFKKTVLDQELCDCPTCTSSRLAQAVTGHECARCGFGKGLEHASAMLAEHSHSTHNEEQNASDGRLTSHDFAASVTPPESRLHLSQLPNEILLVICDHLDEQNLFIAARAWNGFSRLIREYNIIRTRELQCFALKKSFNQVSLGVGVHVRGKNIQSEFELLSHAAFFQLRIRNSIHGLPFSHWLPLPISQRHWLQARRTVEQSLDGIGREANVNASILDVLYTFMNDVVVRLSDQASGREETLSRRRSYLDDDDDQRPKSTLTHASERAIEAYFHLYHLLLCLATERPAIAAAANDLVQIFVAGKTDKQTCPNLGHLLTAMLIANVEITEDLLRAVIKEAITRNVVWMLDTRGADKPELSFLEADAQSDYRLQHTFAAGRTSYTLLTFQRLLQRTVAENNQQGRTLVQRRDALFARHGAPPAGAAERLATAIRQPVTNFPQFLKVMGVAMPGKAEFCAFLKRTVEESVKKGYSQWGLEQEEALALRLREEPEVGVPTGLRPAYRVRRGWTFFPQRDRDWGRGRGRSGGRW